MESLLKLSGILNEQGEDVPDLEKMKEKFLAEKTTSDGSDQGTLERRPVDKSLGQSSGGTPTRTSERSSKAGSLPRTLDSRNATPQTPQIDRLPASRESVASPAEPTKDKGEPGEPVEELSDMMCSLVTNNCGETRYIGRTLIALYRDSSSHITGSSSGFSIFSPKGIQWVNEKTGDNSFQDMIASADVNEVKWNFWKPEVFNDLFEIKAYIPLPPEHEALSLLKDFFANFNCMFPLFHEPTFMHLVKRHYSRNPYEGSGWWASLNVALAIAHRLRIMSNVIPQEDDHKAWGYLKNAMGVLTEITMRNTDLLSVQALLGMVRVVTDVSGCMLTMSCQALFLMGTPNPQPSFFLVAAAIRLANSIGLHKRGSAFNLNSVEIEQRKRVFWIAYLLDKE